MSTYRHLGQYLKQKREEAGYTQAGLSKALRGVHTQFVSNWERGICAPPGHCLNRLVDILKLDRAEIVEMMLEDCRVDIERKILAKSSKNGSKSKI